MGIDGNGSLVVLDCSFDIALLVVRMGQIFASPSVVGVEGDNSGKQCVVAGPVAIAVNGADGHEQEDDGD